MIARWLQTAAHLFFYFCAATLLSQVIILGYLWSTWQLDREKIIQMLAVAQGIDLFAAQTEGQMDFEEVPPEQPSYEDWIDRRATMFRDLELRELALENALARLELDQRQLAEDQKAAEQLQADFEARLLAMKQGARAEGRQTVGRILETMKPKQAKEQILEMLDNDEMHEVVALLSEMTESKRAKILGEFETEEENQKISEVLRLIREGKPASSLADEALGQIESDQTAGTY
jgi:hypothetical protein